VGQSRPTYSEGNSRSANPRYFWNLKVHYHIQRIPLESLFWVKCIQSILSHPIPLRYILILSSHLRLGLTSGLFPSGFLLNFWRHFISLPFVLHAISWCYNQNNKVQSRNCEAPHFAVFSSLLLLPFFHIPILFSTLSSDTLNLCFPLNMRPNLTSTQKNMWSYSSVGQHFDHSIKSSRAHIFRNVGFFLQPIDAAVCPRRFY
jgi:hypothetical protein